ncbi:PTS glucose transporter subunit IIABC [Lactiplantibacillus fabifermentans T30PCM01]|uniref:PTS glucose transporter subunit IIABC n=1 Tax=Lactiplantibacillus fabifermentans T30PCM01 TaxID=1400520 RepID=W6TCL4_9LACO|nr:PTS glucose transporter subunit IIA [Lactiplantibacillus fabifermentans]ETY74595.1 PTS glucose transporter subunit IIABC [Lactiplantibacillus fabifermentans T30PCM01]
MMKLFQRKHQIKLVAPVNGMYVDLRQVGAEKISAGFAIEPMEGQVHAPVAGTVTALTNQVLTLQGDFGCEYIVQLGQPTSDLDVDLFGWQVAVGDAVTPDTLLATMDINSLHAADQLATLKVRG